MIRALTGILIVSLAVLTVVAARYGLQRNTDTRAQAQVTTQQFQPSPVASPAGPLPSTTVAPSPTPTPRVISNLLANDEPKPTFKPKVVPFANPLPVLNPDVIMGDINNYRAENGKPKLEKSDELCTYANRRASYLIANNMAAFLTSENGKHTGLSAQTRGYSGSGVGENLAALVTSDQETLTDWKSSPSHNSLLLATDIEGIAITKGCIATKVENWGSIVVFLAGDK